MKYTFSTEADKQAAIAAQEASHNETKEIHDKHLAELREAQVTG